MPLTIEQFTQRLSSSGVIADDELREWLDKLPPPKRPRDGEQLARELVKRKRLTAYQALEIYMGKGQSLVLGNYVILDKLGEGGMGLVLKAEHRRMRRVVALKVMNTEALKTRGAIQRFEREVQAAARLEHPNIVTAYDADLAGDTHFLVMQFVEGEDLSAIVKRSGPLPLDRAVDCVLQAARGLEFAHQNGVVHRDIKPHNLLLSKEGVVKILDMGLARIEEPLGSGRESTLTSTGAVLGTIDYMSPEQAEDTKQADARSDIYSLGCTLFYLLTGKAPYFGETTMKRLLAHRESEIPSLADRIDESSQTTRVRNLDSVFQKMLAKRPANRYASMAEVIADLERCQIAATTKAMSVSLPSEDSKFNDFLARISDPNYSETSVAPQATALMTGATPMPGAASADAATVQFQSEASDTDHSTLTSVKSAVKRRQQARWWHDPNQLAIAITAAVVLVVVTWLAFFSPKGDSNAGRTPSSGVKPSKLKPGEDDAADNRQSLPSQDGWRDLFDGQDLSKWAVVGGRDEDWQIVSGNVVHWRDGPPGWLGTREEFSDFELSLDFRLGENASSGVLLRADRKSSDSMPGLRIQLEDDHALGIDPLNRDGWTGAVSLVKEPSARASRKANEWQQLHVVCRGTELVVTLNRTKVIDFDWRDYGTRAKKRVPALKSSTGAIGLQGLKGSIDFRRIRIRPLKPGDKVAT